MRWRDFLGTSRTCWKFCLPGNVIQVVMSLHPPIQNDINAELGKVWSSPGVRVLIFFRGLNNLKPLFHNEYRKQPLGDCDVQPGLPSLLCLISHHILQLVGRGLHSSEKVSVNYAELTLSTTFRSPSTLSDILFCRNQGQLLRSSPF